MKRNNSIYSKLATLFIGFAVVLTSCDLEVNPRQSIDAVGALDTPNGIDAAINSIYGRLRVESNYGRDLLALSDALADVGRTTSNSGRLINENNNQPNAHFTAGFWQNSYAAINEANLVLDQLQKGVAGASAAQLARWEGETKFLRALYYFDLVKAYSYIPTAIYTPGVTDQGGIPLELDGVITLEKALTRQTPRATIDQVYNQIYADLNSSIALLTVPGRGIQYASGAAAQALLSRVALYRGDWATAASAATTALGTSVGRVTGVDNYVSGWRQSANPESMFEVRIQLAAESLGVNVSLQSSYTALLNLENKNAQGGWGDFIPNATILGFFGLAPLQLANPATDNNNWDVTRNSDVRAGLYTTGNTVRGAGRQIECTKFISKNGFAFGDNIPVIRKSEMHLNRAEANYHLGNEAESLAELNAFKALRGVGAVTLTGQALLDEILLERFKEFAFEGHRFFDLKRYGRAIVKTTPSVNVQFDDFRILPPIPQREVDGNPNLNQNRGY
ncbi:RagB/SusD family nutrient uptake outer membrane protein [Mariniradius sediminis]|uniref:RagB/SusD family nutrient uptake outer membrane protein n=1 Tax=Mariniradius sediminis TaxID=2909237 RepID=A0ABS9BPA2_9BACT|nr:RagB/SusD family nutrient uptake outer membrane protein [Mariniradius sediminis]MCF1749852.1 RagB/SusD family nutrient uptake outer membrane protein [Mariniradius sediminis]